MRRKLNTIEFSGLAAQQRELEGRLRSALESVLSHGRYILGPEVAELEEELCRFSGAIHAVSCANGTDALVLALRCLDLERGQAVVCPSFTFCATAEAVVTLGGVPVFADVRKETFHLDPESVECAIHLARSEGYEVVGAIAVDLFGLPADYAVLEAIAEREALWLVADAAQSFGGSRNGRRVGTFGSITTTSFFPAKPLGCYGDGGALFTDDADRAALLRSLRVHGSGLDKCDNIHIGLNSRLDTLQAAILLVKLTVFEEELKARQRLAQHYTEALEEAVSVPRLPKDSRSAWAQYTVILPDCDRTAVLAALKERGVPGAVYYRRPLHRQTAYQRYPATAVPVSDVLADRVLSLPMHPYLKPDMQNRVIDAVHQALKRVQLS